MGEEGRHQLVIASHDCHMQGSEPSRRRVRIGASVQQVLGDRSMTGVCREHRRADPRGVGGVDIGPGGDEKLRRRQIAGARCKHQGGVAAVWDLAVVLGTAVRWHRHHLAPHI